MAVQYKDYYQTLGVAKTASQDEIRSAFRKLARKHHPDVNKDKVAAEAKFKEINEAYEVLSDPDKRQKYDTLGADWERGGRPGPGAGGGFGGMGGAPGGGDFSFGGTGFSDFFEQFFGGGGRRGRGAARPNPMGGGGMGGFGFDPSAGRGSDVEADLLVTLEEALHGTKKPISFRRGESGKVETFNVNIPKGVREGQRIRLAGQGEPGAVKGQAGDLLLRVRLAQHPYFRVEDGRLFYDLELPVWEAVLGTEATVNTLDGAVKLRIPAGTQPGQKFRLRGRGLPQEGGVRGDLLVVAEVTVPKTVSAEARTHWEALGRGI